MTTSETANLEQANQRDISYSIEKPSSTSDQNMLYTLKFIEYFLAAAFVSASMIIYVFSENKDYVIAGAVSLTILIFLFLFNRQLFQNYQNAVNRSELTKKAELYTYLLSSNNSLLEQNSLIPARQKALQYSQDLIDDYKKVRNVSRNLYYGLQISTVVLSGVTPILVLVDKLEAGQAWLKWLPVICPAAASIVASIVTSFPFQKNSLAANTAVELLEAEQEKFILGVTPLYRCYDVIDETEQQQKASQAIEQFIMQVNNIHLQLVKQTTDSPAEKKEKKEPDSSEQSKSEQS
ncbi:DUF4231 domain-containing protein [Cylindrospermum sp. FACHB-282]|uniref:DUF4231 domain-containing protein n=1 Tax=Cylindrospermum sp. FACHB-282 TaxID=2692794 RepID=UPI001682C164|nr:DUF4231 domain-containing protein [Cylindrospermum sp. FACHB-282]MBD2386874.1 DUF4231 domain-containing protein [Cylindrospermum sp. FACHB-282]